MIDGGEPSASSPENVVSVWQDATAEGKFASRVSDKRLPFPPRVLSCGEKGNRRPRSVCVCMCVCVETRDATYVIVSPADRILDRRSALLRPANKAGEITGSRPAVSICARARRLTGYWRAVLSFSLSPSFSSILKPPLGQLAFAYSARVRGQRGQNGKIDVAVNKVARHPRRPINLSRKSRATILSIKIPIQLGSYGMTLILSIILPFVTCYFF